MSTPWSGPTRASTAQEPPVETLHYCHGQFFQRVSAGPSCITDVLHRRSYTSVIIGGRPALAR